MEVSNLSCMCSLSVDLSGMMNDVNAGSILAWKEFDLLFPFLSIIYFRNVTITTVYSRKSVSSAICTFFFSITVNFVVCTARVNLTIIP